jgi:hypothetical protein
VAYASKNRARRSPWLISSRTLQRQEQASGAGGTPTFLSSHPNSAADRQHCETTGRHVRQQQGGRASPELQRYLRLIEGSAPYEETRARAS